MRPVEDCTFVVTGATDGIGRELARELVGRGATVIVHGRSPERVGAAVAELAAAGPGRAEGAVADFAALAQVRELADALRARDDGPHVLVNNAGVRLRDGHETTEDGFELTWQVNHLAAFLLTRLLEDSLLAAAPTRVVNVSSNVHRQGRLEWEDPNALTGSAAYAQSKLAMVMWTITLAERVPFDRVTVNATHPGWIGTKLGQGGPGSLAQGADTPLWLATEPGLDRASGAYYVEREQRATSEWAQDPDARTRLWELSERQVGLA